MSVEIGSYLRQARESIGLSLDQLQEKTKIQKSFLIAIENGEFNKLPSPFYVRTYLRSYANCVKVEPHHILRQYRKEEQAERGLTGVHKAINESDLAHTRSFQAQRTTTRMPMATGPQKTLNQSTGSRSDLSNMNRIHRTSANTALTIAKSTQTQANDLARKEYASRQMARRDLGYQRTGNARSTHQMNEMSTPPQPQEMPSLNELASNKNVRPKSEMAAHSRGARFQTNDVPSATSRMQRPVVSENTLPSTPNSSPAFDEATNNSLPIRRVREKQKDTQAFASPVSAPVSETGTLSRSSRSRKVVSQASLPPMAPPELSSPAQENLSSVTEGVTHFQQLSRSKIKNRKAKSSSKSPAIRIALILVASIAVCVPLAWGGYHLISGGNGSQAKKNVSVTQSNVDQSNNQNVAKKNSTLSAAESKSSVTLAGKDGNTNNYVVSNDEVEIKIRGSSDASCFVQLRSDMYPKGKMIEKPFSVRKDWKTEIRKYSFSQYKDIWIQLGTPSNAVITVNGQAVDSAMYIHLKKAD